MREQQGPLRIYKHTGSNSGWQIMTTTKGPPAPPYEVGSVLNLRRDRNPAWADCVDKPQELKLKITKLQQPWTLSCGMLVDVLTSKETSASDTTQTAFLKLYDW